MAARRKPTIDDMKRDDYQSNMMLRGMNERDSWVKAVQRFPLDDHPDEREQGMKRLGLTEEDMRQEITA